VVNQLKKDIREKILNLLRNQKEEERFNGSLVILERLFATPEFKKAKTILFYASFDGEVQTFEMMVRAKELGKKIALPTIIRGQKKFVPTLIDNSLTLEDGPYGIKQPPYNKSRLLACAGLDLCVVPGVAFDEENYRLGRGAGYYDRFLTVLPEDLPTIGLAFRFQLVESLPRQAHDVPVSQVISN
jgi:5-formyltetrahydrofolate cyclo-ligase